MKKKFSFAICVAALAIWSCNNSSSSTTGADTSGTSITGDTASNANTTNAGTTTTPLTKDDSSFVMEAAIGGMMEVEAGNLAQQNAASQRVKDFGSMMVTDHSKANDELKSLASSHGMMLPDSLPADKRKHMDQMKKMTGKAFDKHYVDMMVGDHKTDIGKFKMAAEKCNDNQLKTWASATLPTLQKHMDSIQAIKKGM